VAPAARQGGTANPPSGEVCLARRLNAPLGRGPPHLRAQRPLRRGPPRSRAPACSHRPRSCPRVQAFNALTPQDARHDPDTPRNHAPVLFHRLPGEGLPRHCVTLCDETGVSPVYCTTYSCTADAPSPRRGADGTLEYFFRDYTGLRCDVRPAGAVFPIAVSPVRSSPPLQRHAGHCDDIPDVVGAHGDGTSPRLPPRRVRTPR
jgi:hypothetical protein